MVAVLPSTVTKSKSFRSSVMRWAWANWIAFSNAACARSVARKVVSCLSMTPSTAFVSGIARNAWFVGRTPAIRPWTSAAVTIWLASRSAAAAWTSGSATTRLVTATNRSVTSRVRCAQTATVLTVMPRQARTKRRPTSPLRTRVDERAMAETSHRARQLHRS